MRFGDIFGIGVKMLEIEIGNELIDGIKDLAIRHYGDNGDNSVSRVVEDALLMRLVLLEGLGSAGQEVGEPIINWEPQESSEEGPTCRIQDWLFRSRPL